MSNPKLNSISALFETLHKPEGEEANVVLNSPRAAILRSTGAERLCFMEPASLYDAMIEGVTMLDGEVVVVYNEQAVIAGLAMHRFEGDPSKAIDYFSQHRDDRPEGMPHPPVFVTNIVDLYTPDQTEH